MYTVYMTPKRLRFFIMGMCPKTLQEDNPAVTQLDVQTLQRILRSSWMSPPE